MAGPTSSLTPEIGRIHFLDLAQKFRVCASFQLQTPLGNFPHQEFCVDAADLGSAVIQLLRFWGSAPSGGGTVVLAAPKGSVEDLSAYALGEWNALTTIAPTFPVPLDNNSTPDEGVAEYTGDYGVTPPPGP